MKDSRPDTADAPDTPTERPPWRFSGRRGTPVHLRERTPATLPPEIRQAISKMAKAQSGDATQAAEAPKSQARTNAEGSLRMANLDRSGPPVAGAPMPVERRSGTKSGATSVTTTPLDSVPPPAPVPAPPTLDGDPDDLVPPPLIEGIVEAEIGAEAVEAPAAAATSAEAKADTPASTSKPAAKLTPAERRKRAKSRAKARAEKRRLFASGRDVDATTKPVAVEPVFAAADTSHEPVQLFVTPEPAATVADVDLGTAPPSDVPAAASAVAPDPRIAADSASQAAWELGRLPILLAPTTEGPPAPAPPPLAEQVEPELAIPAADGPGRMPPMAWKAVGANPRPAPIEPSSPRQAMPDAIARLDSTLFAPRAARASRAGTREGGSVTHDVATSRQRVAQRRADLADLVGELGELSRRVEHTTH